MKELKKHIKRILVEGLLENKLPELEKFVIENFDKDDKNELSNSDIEDRIYSRFLEKKKFFEELDLKLKSPENLNFLGEYIVLLISRNETDYENLLKKIKMDRKIFKDFLKNNVDVTKIETKKIVTLLLYFNINLPLAKNLIKKSVKLFQLNPSLSNAMARYSHKDGQNERAKSMKSGLNELLLKASEKKEFKSEKFSQTNIKVEDFLEQIEKEYKDVSNPR